jgi:soluble lytic murein transglycosylase
MAIVGPNQTLKRWSIILLFLVGGGAILWFWLSRYEDRFDPQIRRVAQHYRLPPSLVKAVVWKESRFDPSVRGRAGEIGLMQVTAVAAQEWADALKLTRYSHEQILDPSTNLHAGSFYLSKVLQRYAATDNPTAYALADYNAGRRNVLRWMSATNAPQARTNSAQFLAAMTYPGTRQYVEQILERRRRYESQFAQDIRSNTAPSGGPKVPHP